MGNPIFDPVFCYGNHDMPALDPGLLEKPGGVKPETAGQMRRLIMMEYSHTDDIRRLKKQTGSF